MTLKRYLGLLLHDWAGLLGIFSLVGAFVPVIGPFTIIVAMVAIPFAGYRVSRRLVNDHTARVARRKERHFAEVAQREERLARLERPAVPTHVRAAVEEAWKALPLTFQNVVRVLFVAGQMTDAEMVREMKAKLGAGAPNPLEGISNESTLVERVEHTAGRGEPLVEYRGPYQIQPAFRRALGELMGLEE